MKPERGDEDMGVSGSKGLVFAIAGLIIAAGAAVAGGRFFGGGPADQGLQGALGALALGLVVAAPAVLALLTLGDRPALLLPAAVMLIPLSFISFALVTLPLLVPAAMAFVGYGRRARDHPIGPGRAMILTVTVLALLVAAFLALVVHPDPREYVLASGGGGSTSDIITYAESLLSLSLVAAAFAAGWALSKPAPATRLRPDPANSTQ